MLIDEYFVKFQDLIKSCRVVRLTTITYDKRGSHEAFIHGEISFIDKSVLHVREFVDTAQAEEKLMYVYHYVDESQQLIFRYDNTGHHKKLDLPTFPHHKHVKKENTVMASPVPDVSTVLQEIELLVKLT